MCDVVYDKAILSLDQREICSELSLSTHRIGIALAGAWALLYRINVFTYSVSFGQNQDHFCFGAKEKNSDFYPSN